MQVKVVTVADIVYLSLNIGHALSAVIAPVYVVVEKGFTRETGYIGTLLPVTAFGFREMEKGYR